ncbi:MAG: XdhC family protein [Actinobacteria bacterium]|nr:XdhC family protein [Actinomycetota bacterium]
MLSGDTAHRGEAGRAPTAESSPALTAVAVARHGDPPCRVGQRMTLSADGPLEGTLGCAEFDAAAAADARSIIAAGEPVTRTYHHDLGSIDVYLEPMVQSSRLVILGATPVAESLLRHARSLGYEPVLVEPRAERITPAHRTSAALIEASPDGLGQGVFDAIHTDHDAPLVAEHLALLVRAGARFVGLMGSRRHAGPHLAALAEQGLTPEQVARVQTPVGLDLGARSPEEIALSILAGLVAARTGRSGGWLAERPA